MTPGGSFIPAAAPGGKGTASPRLSPDFIPSAPAPEPAGGGNHGIQRETPPSNYPGTLISSAAEGRVGQGLWAAHPAGLIPEHSRCASPLRPYREQAATWPLIWDLFRPNLQPGSFSDQGQHPAAQPPPPQPGFWGKGRLDSPLGWRRELWEGDSEGLSLPSHSGTKRALSGAAGPARREKGGTEGSGWDAEVFGTKGDRQGLIVPGERSEHG